MSDHHTERPLACWVGKERYAGAVHACLTIIFRTGGCAWNRCRMCGYRHEGYRGAPEPELVRRIQGQMAWVMDRYDPASYEIVKLFTSGSFFDSVEVPERARSSIAEALRGKIIIAETRPEYVDSLSIGGFLDAIDDGSWSQPLSVAMGLETTNDFIREKCIDKGHTFADFIEAADNARNAGAGVKTYLLMKPPFLTEQEALEDMQESIRLCSPYSDMISMNLCTVQTGTEVEYYWKHRAYRPPYLWSVLDVLITAEPHVTCDPVGGGYPRGPHNCGQCDGEILRGIREYSLTGDRELLSALRRVRCGCKREWEFVLSHELPHAMPLTR